METITINCYYFSVPDVLLVKDPRSGPLCSLNPRSSLPFINKMYVRFLSGCS